MYASPDTDSNTSALPLVPSITLENVSFSFSGGTIFDALDFKVTGGKWTCLLGPSGVGKSTLLRLISGSLREGFSGKIRLSSGGPLKGLTAWMAQKDLLLPWLTVIENVCLGARLRGERNPDTYTKARVLLKKAGLEAVSEALPSALSGGMRQRVALLRTLMEDRQVILMDEPFSALDALTRLKLQNLAAKLVKGATVLLVTHDPLEALRLGHRIHVMTGQPARLDKAMVPPGRPPRKLDDPELVSLQAHLLRRLNGQVNG